MAMADIYAAIVALVRTNMANPEKLKVPKRSEALGGWCLPMMSKSLKADEKEREALELFESVRRLKKRYGSNEQ